MSSRWSLKQGGARSRVGSVAVIVLLHVLMAALLLRHAATPQRDDDGKPASYIAFAFIAAPKPAPPAAQAAAVPVMVPVPVVVTPPVRRTAPAKKVASAPVPVAPRSAPEAAVAAPEAPATRPDSAQAAQAPHPGIDMAALRASARQIDSERVPTAQERREGPEQLLSTDDSKLARAVREAKRPDCQKKYSGGTSLNLILLIPLAIETITDKGCKW